MTDHPVERIQHTHIGGQAVLEGIMMRGKLNWAIAVRMPDGDIHVEEHDLHSAAAQRAWLRKPLIRGVWGLYETMALAMKALSISARYAGESEEEQLTSREVGLTMVLGVALAVGLFIVLPAFAARYIVGTPEDHVFTWNIVNGLVRLTVFFLYIWAVSRMKEIQRVFAYHGAEHKTIHAYEHGLPLETETIQRYETMHVRCGTSFLLMVMVIAVVVYMLIPIKPLLISLGVTNAFLATLVTIGVHLLMLPFIAGLAYEVIKWAGARSQQPLVRVLLWPGLMLQKMTTREPEDDMVEVAVMAMRRIVDREEGRVSPADPEGAAEADAEGAVGPDPEHADELDPGPPDAPDPADAP